MVLLIGNYPLDQQHSMQRFGDMMLRGLRTAGVEAELVVPTPFFGKLLRPGVLSKWLGYFDKYIAFPRHLRRQLSRSPAVIHICDHSNAVYVKQGGAVPFVVTCHDLLAVRGGLGEATDCPASFTGRLLQRWILRGLRRANAVACVSSATAEDANRLVRPGNDRTDISVVPLALNFDYRQVPRDEAWAIVAASAKVDIGSEFILHVGSNLRRKNRDGVIRIFALTKDKWNGQLVFAGEPLTQELLGLGRELGVDHRIVQVATPPPEVLRALYNCAMALLFPSRFEGFGWPIIEAQACACPVICSNTGPLPEAAGAAGLYHDVNDEKGFAEDVLRLTIPPEREEWSKKSLLNAQRFSTDKMIRQYIELYRRVGANL